MGTSRTRTALYSETARRRLGKAVADAREAAGYTSTAELARATGRAARAIYALENAEPTVGQSVLQAVGRTLGERLDGWTENTPRAILEGADAPPLADISARKVEVQVPGGRNYSREDIELAVLLARRGQADDAIFRVIDEPPASGDVLPTVEPRTGTDQ